MCDQQLNQISSRIESAKAQISLDQNRVNARPVSRPSISFVLCGGEEKRPIQSGGDHSWVAEIKVEMRSHFVCFIESAVWGIKYISVQVSDCHIVQQ